MSILDILFTAVVAAFALVGVKRGFVAEVFRLIALLGGFVAAYLGHGIAYRRLPLSGIPAEAGTAVAFVAVFLGVAAALLLVGWLVKKIVHLVMLGWLDRLLGGCVGAAKSLVLVWAAVLVLSVFPGSGTARFRSDSRVYRMLTRVPLSLALPPRAGLRRYEELIGAPTDKLQKARRRFEEFRDRADSLKALADRDDGPGGRSARELP